LKGLMIASIFFIASHLPGGPDTSPEAPRSR
jgi:hypothetical protein